MSGHFSFLDTNTFLHYKSIDHIDWLNVLGTSTVVLVVSAVVIRELNRHKDSPSSPKTRERAASALKKLHDWSEQSSPIMIRPSVELQFRVQDPLLDFAAERLSRDVPDDYLIASMIEHRREHSNCTLSFVTADLGLKLKAKQYGITVIQLTVDLRLPEELSTIEKRNRELEAEVKRLQSRSPKLKLLFHQHDTRIRVALPYFEESSVEATRKQIEDLPGLHPKMEPALLTEKPRISMAEFEANPDLALGISEGRIDKYNEDLETYYHKYEKYLRELENFLEAESRTVALNIEIVNEGTCPAEDVVVAMHFPDGFLLLSKEQLPKKPLNPKPPRQPKNPIEEATELMQNLAMPDLFLNRNLDFKVPTPQNVSSPSIRRTKSFVVTFTIRKIKHKFREALEPLYVVFDARESAHSFTIDSIIYASNLPDMTEGQLHVVVEKDIR